VTSLTWWNPEVHPNLPSQRRPGRLAAWLVFVLSLTTLAYVGRIAGSGGDTSDLAYRYETSIAGVVQYALMLGILLLIARGLSKRDLFALRRPGSWRRALGLAAVALVSIWVFALVYERVVSLFGDWNPTTEQGLVPDEWDSSRAGAFAAFFVMVTVLAPVVEELTYRGLGVSLVLPYGTWLAILVTGVLFGAAHGLLVALPVLAFFGAAVAWLRTRTDSVYPGMLLHGTFNGVALLAAVTIAS
jgi:membrane protease YdiL (CAAX protease family)